MRPPDRSFMDRGACHDMDPDIFFPEGGDTPYLMRRAVRACTGCPVRAECYRYAVDLEIRHGVWGGVLMSTVRAQRATGAVRIEGQRVPAQVIAEPDEAPAWWRVLMRKIHA